jgi:hypothetical protein
MDLSPHLGAAVRNLLPTRLDPFSRAQRKPGVAFATKTAFRQQDRRQKRRKPSRQKTTIGKNHPIDQFVCGFLAYALLMRNFGIQFASTH